MNCIAEVYKAAKRQGCLKGQRVAHLLVLVLGVMSFSISAQGETLLQAYKLAHQNDSKFRAAQAEARARATATDQAKAGFWPSIKLELETQSTKQAIVNSNNPVFGPGTSTYPTNSYTLSVTQPVFRRDVIERFEQSKVVVRESQLKLLAAEQDLLLRTTSAYLSVLAANDAWSLARAEKTAVERALYLARERLKGGLGTVTEQYEASARFAVSQAREIEAQNKLNDARQGMREITQQSLEAYQTLRDAFPMDMPEPIEQQMWVDAALGQNLLLRALRETTQISSLEVKRQQAGHFPSLNLVYSYNRRDAGSTLFGGGSDVRTGDLSLRLNVPIYEGGQTAAVVAEAVQRLSVAQENEEQERRAVERKTRAAYDGVVTGIGLVSALKQAVVSQESALQAKTVGTQSGRFTLLTVLDAQRDLFLAKRDYAQARYEYLLNVLKLKDATGALSEADLLTVHAALQ